MFSTPRRHLYILNENFDTSTPTGKAMLGMMSVFAQLERETIRERTRMGMLGRLKEGYWPGGARNALRLRLRQRAGHARAQRRRRARGTLL